MSSPERNETKGKDELFICLDSIVGDVMPGEEVLVVGIPGRGGKAAEVREANGDGGPHGRRLAKTDAKGPEGWITGAGVGTEAGIEIRKV